LVADIKVGQGSSSPNDFTVYDGKLYFEAETVTNGRELFVYNGTSDRVELVRDFVTGTASSHPSDFTVYNNKLYFNASNWQGNKQLLTYDSKTGDIEAVAALSEAGGIFPRGLTIYNNKLYFRAYSPSSGEELYVYDAHTGDANLVADIHSGIDSSYPKFLTVYNGKLYFNAIADAETGAELYVYDESTDTVELVAEFDTSPFGDGRPYGFAVYNNKLYFSAEDEELGDELFVYDDVSKTAVMVEDLAEGFEDSRPRFLQVYNNKLYMSAYTRTKGSGLYVFDSVSNSINLAVDPPIASGPSYLTVYDNKLFYTGYSAKNGKELYVYDSTTRTSQLVADINQDWTLVISGRPLLLVAENDSYSFTPTADDAEGDPITFSVLNKPSWANFNPVNGQLSGTPGFADAGEYAGVEITVSDDTGNSAILKPFTITVTNTNRLPSITGTPPTEVTENSSYNFIPTASDDDDEDLTFSIVNQPSWAAFNSTTGALSGTPSSSDVGVFTGIEITVSDGYDNVALDTFSIEVKALTESDPSGDSGGGSIGLSMLLGLVGLGHMRRRRLVIS
jgi:ELWxxDGT repeat protein